MKHVVCYSGGHSSAMVAVEVVRKFGKENVILLNHDMAGHVETADIKRFKREIAEYLGLPITYANHKDLDEKQVDQFDVCIKAKAFKVGNQQEMLCTSRLKTEPFMKWLKENIDDVDLTPEEIQELKDSDDPIPKDCIVYYGFDDTEPHRVQRKIGILAVQGYRSDYPCALWPKKDRTIHSSEDIGIRRPNSYDKFKHANCIGCLKAKKTHWYLVYLQRPDIFEKAKAA